MTVSTSGHPSLNTASPTGLGSIVKVFLESLSHNVSLLLQGLDKNINTFSTDWKQSHGITIDGSEQTTHSSVSGFGQSNNESLPDLAESVNLSRLAVDDKALFEINRQKAHLLIPAILYTVVLMVVGVIGNPLAIYIYGFKWQRTTTRVFLFCLAVLDLVNCIITMPTEIYVMANFYYFPDAGFCRMSRFTTYLINNASAAIFVIVAIDRYVRICHPHRRTMSISGAQVACVLACFIGAGVSWPALVLYGSKKVPLPHPFAAEGYVLGVICDVKNEMDSTPYPFAFFIYLWCGFSTCCLILSFLYILIGRVMLRRSRKHSTRTPAESSYFLHNGNRLHDLADAAQELTSTYDHHDRGSLGCTAAVQCADSDKQKGRRPRSTLMLFAITAVFVLSFLPFLIIMTIRQQFGQLFYPSLSPWQQVLVNLFSRSYLVNNCANPIVYGMCNSQFRRQVRKLLHITAKSRDVSLSREESRLSRGFTC